MCVFVCVCACVCARVLACARVWVFVDTSVKLCESEFFLHGCISRYCLCSCLYLGFPRERLWVLLILCIFFLPPVFSLREHPCAPSTVNMHYFAWIFFSFFFTRHINFFYSFINTFPCTNSHLLHQHFTTTESCIVILCVMQIYGSAISTFYCNFMVALLLSRQPYA